MRGDAVRVKGFTVFVLARLLQKVRMDLWKCGGGNLNALFRISRQPELISLGNLSPPLEHRSAQRRVEDAESFEVNVIVA